MDQGSPENPESPGQTRRWRHLRVIRGTIEATQNLITGSKKAMAEGDLPKAVSDLKGAENLSETTKRITGPLESELPKN